MIAAIALLGAASVLAYLWRRQWIDAALVALAAAALGLLAAGRSLPGQVGGTLAVDGGTLPAQVAAASALTLSGDGLRAAEWRDMAARPLHWTVPSSPVLHLDFPRQLALGRMFRLAAHRSVRSPGRLQLLAENGQVLADAHGDGDLAVQWLPPVAEPLVLQARLFDGAGKLVAHGPVPVVVHAPAPLRVQGRFNAPSFDLRVLNGLLASSAAQLDWQVTLGKNVTSGEVADKKIDAADLLVIDAAWFEHAPVPARTALLEQVAQGAPLLVLGGDAADAGLWSRALQLDLEPQPVDRHTPGALPMTVASLAPAASRSGPWQGSDGALWTRPWHKGHIGWLGVADWHRYAITEPQALALWWQDILDRLGVSQPGDVAWLDPGEMPLPGQRLEVCAQDVHGDAVFASLGQTLAWQRRPDRADASCVAVWPRQPGWLDVRAPAVKGPAGRIYVFADDDWPLWQAAQRRDATARYAARTPAPLQPARGAAPAWPFALAFALAMLLLWWRERR